MSQGSTAGEPWSDTSGLQAQENSLFSALQGLVDALEKAPGLGDEPRGKAAGQDGGFNGPDVPARGQAADTLAHATDEVDKQKTAINEAVAEASKARLAETTVTEYEVRPLCSVRTEIRACIYHKYVLFSHR